MLTIMQTVLDTARREALFSPNDTVYVALSGGADSVMLLHVLRALQNELSLKAIRALHVNHGLRGDCAERDETFVRELCAAFHVPLTVERADVPALVCQTHQSVEEAARDVRYAFFQRATEGVQGAKIATAHTADDRAETVLMNLVRGCSLRGLGGIPYRRGNVVRPLLDCTAKQIRDCAASNEFAFVQDETNDDPRYTRNYVRHWIMPSLREINPSVVSAILRLADTAVSDDDYLQNKAQLLLENAQIRKNTYACQAMADADIPIASRALATAFANASGCFAERRHVQELLRVVRHTGSVSLPKDWIARCDGRTIRFHQGNRTAFSDEFPQSTPLRINETTCFLGESYTSKLLTKEEFSKICKIHKNFLDFCLDYDKIEGTLYFRTRQDGDTFRPHKRHCTKTLKRFFQEQHIPADERQAVPLLCDDNGILAVFGCAVDERVAIDSAATRILLVRKHSEGRS